MVVSTTAHVETANGADSPENILTIGETVLVIKKFSFLVGSSQLIEAGSQLILLLSYPLRHEPNASLFWS